jgi:putative intracellular protease/amidase
MLSMSCLLGALAALPFASSIAADAPSAPANSAAGDSHIDRWQPRLGRTRPIVVVIAENSGTELVDFMIPFGVLTDSGVADVIALSTRPGAVQLRPSLRVRAQEALADFDESTPLGADYVIVPAFTEDKVTDPATAAWLRAQSAKGATVMSICDGALIVANAGLFDGHRATGHWATDKRRRAEHPGTQWVSDARYVADGNVISSAGVSAAIPASLALVEAIGGIDAATRTATHLGATAWGGEHDSRQFRVGAETILTYIGNRYFRRDERIIVPVANGVDEIALALTLDAYGRTMRSPISIRTMQDAPVRSLHGLTLLSPDHAPEEPFHELALADVPSFTAFDRALVDIGQRFGPSSERYVALEMEYAPAYAGR